MISFLVHRPTSVISILIVLLIASALSIYRIPTELLPDLDVPKIKIVFQDLEFSQEQTETLVASKLRNHLNQLSGIENINTRSYDGGMEAELKYEVGTNINYAYIELNDKIDQLISTFSSPIPRPSILKYNSTDIAVFKINITANNKFLSHIDLSELTTFTLKNRIEQLSQVAFVDVTGLAKPIISITPSYGKLLSLGVSEQNIIEAITIHDKTQSIVTVNNGTYEIRLRIGDILDSIKKIEEIAIPTIDNRIVKLKSIASIEIRERFIDGMYSWNGKRAIALKVIQKPGSNINELKKEVVKTLNLFTSHNEKVMWRISNDESERLTTTMSSLKQSIIVGCIATFFIVILFSNQFSIALIIFLATPVSLIITILFFYLLDISLNIISLSGLLLCLGLMIDNSIIVVDNIIQRFKIDLTNDSEYFISGSEEIASPLITSALTTCITFIPLIFLSGLAGALFTEQAISIFIGLSVSLVVSLIFIPTILSLSKRNFTQNNEEYLYSKIESQILVIVNNPKIPIFIFLIFGVSGFMIYNELEKSALVEFEENTGLLTIRTNQNVNAIDLHNAIITTYENVSSKTSEFSIEIGKQDYLVQDIRMARNMFRIYYSAIDNHTSKEIEQELGNKIKALYPNCKITYEDPPNVFNHLFQSSERGNKIVLRINRNDKHDRYQTYKNRVKEMNKLIKGGERFIVPTDNIISVSFNMPLIVLNNIRIQKVLDKIQYLTTSNFTGVQLDGKKYMPLSITSEDLNFKAKIESTHITNATGQNISLKNIVDFSNKKIVREITADVRGEYLEMNISKYLFNQLSTRQNNKEYAQTTVDFELTSSNPLNSKVKKEASYVLALSILLLYFVLSAQFESYLLPLIILLEIPVSITGALVGLYITGYDFNIMAIIGIITMIGIILNDSILKVDTIRKEHISGRTIHESISVASKRRIKPILMTSITTICAVSTFFIFDDFGSTLQRPLAIVLIFGLFFGTIMSIYFIPLWYHILTKIKIFHFRRL